MKRYRVEERRPATKHFEATEWKTVSHESTHKECRRWMNPDSAYEYRVLDVAVYPEKDVTDDVLAPVRAAQRAHDAKMDEIEGKDPIYDFEANRRLLSPHWR